MPVCQSCNNSYDANFKFCPHCGKTNSEPEPIIYHVTSDDILESCETNIVVLPYDNPVLKYPYPRMQKFCFGITWH